MRRQLVILSLFALSCGGGLRPFPTCAGVTVESPALGITGQTVEVNFITCGDAPSSADVAVRDENDDPVDGVTVRVSGQTAIVSFVPTKPGFHHVVVRFQPNLGLAQADVDVARDNSAKPAAIIQRALAPDCYDWDVTASGLLFCPATKSLFTVKNKVPSLMQTLTGYSVFELVGDTIWSSTPAARFEPSALPDGGVWYVQTMYTEGRYLSLSQGLPSASDLVIVQQSGTIDLITALADAGYDARSYGEPFGAGMRGAMVRVGDAVLDVHCTLHLDTADAGCGFDGGAFIEYAAADRDGIWLGDSALRGFAPTALMLRGPEGALGVLQLASAGLSARLPDRDFDAVPIILAADKKFTAAWGQGRIGMQWWGGDIVSANTRTVVVSVDGFYQFYRR